MHAFLVPQNTQVNCIPAGKSWESENIHNHWTQKENCFFVEDLVLDPTGIVESAPEADSPAGRMYRNSGYYGFKRDGWILLVPGRSLAPELD